MRPAVTLAALLALATPAPATAADPVRTEMPGVFVEVYTDRAVFDARLGTVSVVDFDDVDTTRSDVAPFAPDRYKERFGVVITGTGGQYAGRTFGYPADYVPTSRPNSYAPGPKNGGPNGEGGFETRVTFAAGGKPGAVAGFGCVFIDADYPKLGPCSLVAYGAGGKRLGAVAGFSGPSGSQLFRGVVSVDAAGKPVPAVQKVVIQNGSGWPASSAAEGVTLDDFAFSPPVPADVPATETDPARRVKDYLARLVELRAKGDLRAAVAESQLLHRWELAIGLEKALAEYTEAERALPGVPEVASYRGVLYSIFGQGAKARAEYEKALAAKPRTAADYDTRGQVLVNLARLDGRRDRLAAALDCYTESIRLAPDNPGTYADRAQVYEFFGRYEDAVKDCDRAIGLEPSCSLYYYNRGCQHYNLRRDDRAFADFTTAIETDPTPTGGMYFNRGNIHANAGRLDLAMLDYGAAIEQQETVFYLEGRAREYTALGQPHRAAADLRRAAELKRLATPAAAPAQAKVGKTAVVPKGKIPR
jgi:tetratricopeptide (TPR) repeat protein